jgi:hypothetical protein
MPVRACRASFPQGATVGVGGGVGGGRIDGMTANTLRLRSPADVIAAIPYLVGFHPRDSVVILGFGGSGDAYAVRLDLTAAGVLIEHVSGLVARRGSPHVVVAGYGSGEQVTPVVDRVRRALARHGVEPRDVLRVEDRRFWSYLCSEPGCCPVEGLPVGEGPVAADAVAAGLSALPDRADLVRSVEPVGGARMRRATERAERRLAGWADEDAAGRMAAEGVRLVQMILRRAAAGPPPSDEEVAWLGVLMVSLRVRDEAWVRMREGEIDTHIRLWRDVLRRVREPYAPAPACLLAFAAWRAGDGALANIALDRALAADPRYSMARLLRELFISGLPPSAVPMDIVLDETA